MIFIDTCFIIAMFNKRDQWHRQAVKIAKDIENEKKIISYAIIIEVTSLLARKGRVDVIEAVYAYLQSNFIIYKLNNQIMDKSVKTQIKFDGELSLTDALNIEIMKEKNITEIVSFDHHFDYILRIKRISQ